MDAWRAALSELILLVRGFELVQSAGYAALVYSGFFLIVFLFEKREGADTTRYRTRNFANDILYTLFYKGGFYHVLLLAAVTNALGARLDFLRLSLLRDLPWFVGLAIFWIVGDLAMYW